jgi:hypothetical protein
LVSTTALNTALGSYTTTASLTTNYYTKTQADSAISSATTNLVSNSGLATTLGNYPTNATLTTNYYTKTATDSAISSATSTLVSTSTLNNYTTTAALQANYFTKASGTALEGKYTVKVDLNGYVSGFGLASTANDAGATSTFAVRSDSFYIASPSGPGITPTMPFIVRTTPVTIGGVEVPVGVYITDGYIQNGTITNAKIANLAVDNAKIASLSADKIRAGSISVGQYIQSANYVNGSAGWKIDGSGSAEFGAASIRGQLVASQINSNGLSIRAADGTVILSAGSSLGASSFSGDVTGSIAGTTASTVVNTANNANSTANTANSTANSAVAAASTAQGTANTAVSAASTAQNTANNAASAASTAQSTANSAASAAAAAQSAADAKLARAGAQVLTGPVTLNAASAITVGNPALNGQPGFNGFYIGSTGIVGTKNGLTTFALDNAGNATFKGDLTGASGTFSGALSGATGTFSGALSGATGSFSGAVTASTLTADSMNVARRNVLESGVLTLPSQTLLGYTSTYMNDGEGGYYIDTPLPVGTSQLVNINRVVPTNITDDYFSAFPLAVILRQPFSCSAQPLSESNYSGGDGQFNITVVAEVVVNRRYSVGGSTTTDDNRVFIFLRHYIITNVSSTFTYLTVPTQVRWILNRA